MQDYLIYLMQTNLHINYYVYYKKKKSTDRRDNLY